MTRNPNSRSLTAAATAAHRLAVGCLELARRAPDDPAGVLAGLTREATTAALLLEGEPRRRDLLAALRSLWRTSDAIDTAERLGLLSLDAAVGLLALGSRVEIPLVDSLRRGGLRDADLMAVRNRPPADDETQPLRLPA